MTAPNEPPVKLTQAPNAGGVRALPLILDQYAAWFARVVRHGVYGVAAGDVRAPIDFRAWMAGADPATAAGLIHLHDMLEQEAVAVTQGRAAPMDVAAYDRLAALYNDFVTQVQRYERMQLSRVSGVDALTGLRSRSMMDADLAREMERRTRHGQPFSLGLVRIDDFETIRAHVDAATLDDVVRRVAAMVMKTMRSFDDAYRLDNGEFVMSLKQTDSAGGAAAMNRLRHFVAQDDVRVMLNGASVSVELSCCVAEAQPGEDMPKLIQNMREDLVRLGGDLGSAMEYVEISPLERFVHGMNKGEDSR